MTATEAIKIELDGIRCVDNKPNVLSKSRDFYWYSPVLKRQLDRMCGDLVVMPANEEDVKRCLASCFRHDVPVTVRGAGTGNAGQSVPLSGGVVLDLSFMQKVRDVSNGGVVVEPGAKPVSVNVAARIEADQELRIYPTTQRTATIGGFVGGGLGGIGSVNWGTLSDPGNVRRLRLVTMEADPRVLDLTGDDLKKAIHSYGTTGVLTEVEMGLAEKKPWVDVIVGFDALMGAARFADDVARSQTVDVNEVCVISAPFPFDTFLQYQKYLRVGDNVCILIASADTLPELEKQAAVAGGTVLYRSDKIDDGKASGVAPVSEMVWNHTTLRGIRLDPTVTYLQVLYPVENHLDVAENLLGKLDDEITTHLEFIRVRGELTCFAIPIVRYTTDERLNEINAAFEECGCSVYNPHRYTIEEGGMTQTKADLLSFKRESDPKGLLNPGKMIVWEDPNYKVSSGNMYLFSGDEVAPSDFI